MRGSLHATRLSIQVRRSIPARAGEPLSAARSPDWGSVYPRACGGATWRAACTKACPGLSPRVRGSRRPLWSWSAIGGSIPARAGEPAALVVLECHRWVYPRACGGASCGRPKTSGTAGLSPRVRGSHSEGKFTHANRGSIPARAGEPSEDHACHDWHKVYPRACGGATLPSPAAFAASGLSPRVRGSRRHAVHEHEARGSIPARAGEPEPCSRPQRQ